MSSGGKETGGIISHLTNELIRVIDEAVRNERFESPEVLAGWIKFGVDIGKYPDDPEKLKQGIETMAIRLDRGKLADQTETCHESI